METVFLEGMLVQNYPPMTDYSPGGVTPITEGLRAGPGE